MRFMKLAAWLAGLWLFFAVLTPWLEKYSPAWQRFYQVQEENDLHSGAVYYCDVPVTLESELHVREAVRQGMETRRSRH